MIGLSPGRFRVVILLTNVSPLSHPVLKEMKSLAIASFNLCVPVHVFVLYSFFVFKNND